MIRAGSLIQQPRAPPVKDLGEPCAERTACRVRGEGLGRSNHSRVNSSTQPPSGDQELESWTEVHINRKYDEPLGGRCHEQVGSCERERDHWGIELNREHRPVA